MLQAFSDPTSRRILAACVARARSVKEISEETDIPLASAYRHVNDLVAQGILFRSRSAISDEGRRYDLYRSRIRRATLEMTPEGVAVNWEVNEEVEERLERLWKELRY